MLPSGEAPEGYSSSFSFISVLLFFFLSFILFHLSFPFQAAYSLELDLLPSPDPDDFSQVESRKQWAPLLRMHDAYQFHGFHMFLKEELCLMDELRHIKEEPPRKGTFITAAPAFLVALLDAVIEG